MNLQPVRRALAELERRGAKLTLEGDNIRIHYQCPAKVIPAVKDAIALLRIHKQEAIGFLMWRSAADSSDLPKWSAVSLEAEQRFGHHAARLYPFLGKRVRTSLGIGKLTQVFVGRATVLLESELAKPFGEQRETFHSCWDIFPLRLM
jgi:hypothetical protein